MAHIELKNISLHYPILGAVDLSLRKSLNLSAAGGVIRRSGNRSLEISALEDINLTISNGERIGIIGHNGAGKTTLLKVIAGIYQAQKGSFARDGRIATVINPGNGLQMDVTGYENIENIGVLNGLSLKEIRALIPDIAEFTELGDFLGLSVETYSSGMIARLSFAVATALSPDILIVDENLSTGDGSFIERAQNRMESMMERSDILVLASHSLGMLPRFVRRAILLEHGRIVADDTVENVIECYNKSTVPG